MKARISATGIVIALLVIFVTACDHDKLETYSGKEQVYFSFADEAGTYNVIDSVIIRFGYDEIPKTDSTIAVRTKIMGLVRDYERPVNFTLVDSLSTVKLGEDVELLFDRSCIQANSIYGSVYVKLINTDKLTDSTLVAAIRTMPNDYFFADYDLTRHGSINDDGRIKGNVYKIYFDAKNEMPNLWVDMITRFTTVFGDYSLVKLEFICEALEIGREYFTYDPETETAQDVFNARIGSYSIAWGLILNRRLKQYEDEHGERLKDEHGNEVIIPGPFS